MRPSELLRMVYSDVRNETHEIYPAYFSPRLKAGRWVYDAIVTDNVNAVIAKACYHERIAADLRLPLQSRREDYVRDGDPFDDALHYAPYQYLPWAWAIAGGL